MLGTTTTSTGTNGTESPEQVLTMLPSARHLCTSCQITFQDGQEHRVHMKEPWHVYNIKRRIASLPPVTLEDFNAQVKEPEKNNGESPRGRSRSKKDFSAIAEETSLSDEDEQGATPFRCLFCSQNFQEDDDGLTANLEHMRAIHGLFIPDPDLIADMQSFIGYLSTEVREWHECLYCGATKPSVSSIQSHMRDKGHCLVNFDREPELLDFWEEGGPSSIDDEEEQAYITLEQGGVTDLSGNEMYLASGRVISSRHGPSIAVKKAAKRREIKALATTSKNAADQDTESNAEANLPSADLQLSSYRKSSRREEMSLAGISPFQRQALALAEKKAQRSEDVARRAREWVYAKGANLQKYDQVDTKMKMGKQNHKLQPR